MSNIGIYKVLSPSGKVYIGQSWDIKRRHWYYKKGYCDNQPYLSHSFKKYGFDSHAIEVIHELPVDCEQEVMDRYEQLYMDAYKDCGIQLMNIRDAGNRGKIGEESRAKMSKAKKGMTPTKEALERLRYYARNKSEETRAKLSKSHMGNKFRLGIKHKPEDLEKISKASCKYLYIISDKEGNLYHTSNMALFCSEHSLTPQLLGNTFRGTYANGGKSNHHKGYKIIYKQPLSKD